MRIEQLEYFQSICRIGSLRRAAEEMHLSPPALNEAIRGLERDLGVDLLDRHRSGTRVSDVGRNLLPDVVAVLESVAGLRRAAGDQQQSGRLIRMGTVNTATISVVIPAISRFHQLYPGIQVELVGASHVEIERMLLEGSLDFGLVNHLDGDELPARLEVRDLLRGRAVVCLRVDHPLTASSVVSLEELAAEPLIVMRPGYVMHRLLQRLLPGRSVHASCSADGAEMGKIMVAEGLGVTLLPDFSVIGDPLERSGVITWRPLEGAPHTVTMGLMHRRSGIPSRAARALVELLILPQPVLTA